MRAVTLLLAVAAVGLAGCGASGPVASEKVSAAVEKTAAVSSSRVSVVGEQPDERVTGEGLIDFDARLATFDLHFESTEGGQEGSRGQMRFVGTTAYISSSLDSLGGPREDVPGREPKAWVAWDGWSNQAPTLDTLILPFPFIDPTRLFGVLQEVSGEIEGLGFETVRGVEVEGYRFEIDLRRAIDEAPAAHREALLADLEHETEKSIPAEVWVDEDGYARRLFVVVDEEEVTLDFYDFGVAVQVEAPPEDQIEEFDLPDEGWTEYGAGESVRLDEGDYEELEDEEGG
jgi:hypothetical protein